MRRRIFSLAQSLARLPLHGLMAGLLVPLLAVSSVQAANSTWVASPADPSWTNPANWSAGVPGAVGGSANTDTVTFNTPIFNTIGSAANPIINDANRTIGSILFDTANVGAYQIGTLGGNSLNLRIGGNITMSATVANPEVIAAPISTSLPSSTNGLYSFVNNAVDPANTLSFTGIITNTSANTRPWALTLDGANTGNNLITQILDNAGANGAIQIFKNGAGTWILAGANEMPQKTSAGNVAQVNVNAGTLVVQNAASLGGITQPNLKVQGTGTLRIDNVALQNAGITMDVAGTLLANGAATSVNAVNVLATATTTTFATTNPTDVFTIGAGASLLTGTAATSTVINIAGPGQVVLNNASTFAGTWSLNAGTTTLNNPTALGPATSSAVAFGAGSSAKFQLNGNSISLPQLTTNAATPGTTSIENAGGVDATLTLNNSANNTVASVLRDGTGGGRLALTKNGVGSLTLTGNNTYTGNTTISGGTLIANNNPASSATGTGTVTVNTTATLAGSGGIGGAVTIASGAHLSPGSSGVGTLKVGSLALSAGSQLDFDITDTATLDKVMVGNSGGLTINGGQLNINGGAGGFTANGVYNLIGFSGAIGGAGVSALSVNPNNQFVINSFNFGTSSGFVTLTVAPTSVAASFWNVDADGKWSTGPWTSAAAPNAPSAFVAFGGGGTTITAPRTITVDGSYTAGTLAFNNPNFGYTVAAGTGGNITLDNGASTSFITDTAGSHTISVPVTLTANGASVTVVKNTDKTTLSGAIGGPGSISKNGPGTLALTGASAYTGGTNLNAGLLQINSATSLGASSGNLIFAGGSLQLLGDVVSTRNYNLSGASDVLIDTNAHSLTVNGSITPINGGTGNVIKNGAGTLALQGVNTYLGTTTINAGTLSINSNDSLGDSTVGNGVTILNNSTLAATATTSLDNAGASGRPITIGAGGGTIAVDPTMTLTIPGRVTGSTLIVTNTGTLVLANGSDAAANTVPMTVTGGATVAAGGGATGNGGFGTGPITLQGNATLGNVMTAGRLVFGNALTVPAGQTGNLNFPGLPTWGQGNNGLAATGAVSGAGTLNVTTTTGMDLNNNFTNFTGQLNFTGAGPIRAFINGGLFNVNGLSAATVDLGGSVSLTAQTNSTGNTITIGALSGSSATAILGAGSAGGPTWLVGGLNTNTTFLGNIQGNAILSKQGTGTMILAGDSTNTGGIINATGSTIQVGDPTINAGASGTLGNGPISNAGSIVINHSGPMTIPGVISGAGTFSHIGTGNTSLTAANTYSGNTTVTAGILSLNNASGSATGTSVITVSNTGGLSGAGSVSGAATINSGGNLSPGNGGIGTLTFNGPLSLNSGSILNYEFAGNSQPNDLTLANAANGLTINGAGVNVYQAGGTSPFTTNGIYNLIGYSGTIAGSGALSVLNPDPSRSYSFGTAGGFVTLTILPNSANSVFWNVNANGNWSTGSNWTGNVAPNGPGVLASFGGGGATLTASRTVTLDSPRTVGALIFNNSTFPGFTYTIAGTNPLTLDGNSNTAVINDVAGSHTISAPLNMNTDTLINIANAADTFTVSGVVSGASANFAKSGLGTLVLSGANSYSATNSFNLGTVLLSGGGKLGSSSNALNMNGGTLDLGTTSQAVGSLNIAGGDIIHGTLTPATLSFTGSGVSNVSSVIAGTTSLDVNGGAAGKLALSAPNTFSGGINLTTGTLSIAAGNNLGAVNGVLNLNGGALQITGTTFHSFEAARTISGYNSAFDIADPANTFTISPGGAAGAATLVKLGAGTLVLSNAAGPNLYNFSTTASVRGGILQVSGPLQVAQTANQGIEIAPNAGQTATVNVDNGVQVDTYRTIIGGNQANTDGGAATLNVNGGIINSLQWFTVGSFGAATSTTNLNGASVVNVNGAGTTGATTQVEVSDFGAASGILNINSTSQLNIYNGNAANNGDFALGVQNNGSGNGTVNQNGGSVTFFSDTGFSPGGVGRLFLGKGTGRTGTYTYNLNAGTLTVPQITGTSGNRIFNFNGGSLVAAAGDPTGGVFMSGLTTAQIQAGGAKINNNGFNVTISQPLLHDATMGAAAIDGGLTATGAGTLTISGTNTFTGNTTISGGTLIAANTGALENSVLANGGTGFQFASTVASHAFSIGGLSSNNALAFTDNAANNVALSVGGVTVPVSSTFPGSLTGGGSLNKINAGSTFTLTGANSYTGTTTVTAGTLLFGQPSALYNNTPASWTATNIIVNSGGIAAFNVGPSGFTASNIQTFSSLGTATGGFKSGSILGIDTTGVAGNFTYSNVIANPNAGQNALGVAKIGTGTMILNAANTYTGNTLVQGGTLALSTASTSNISKSASIQVGDSAAHNSAALDVTQVNTGGDGFHVLSAQTLGGFGTVTGKVTVDSGAFLSPGASIGTLTIAGPVNLNGTLTTELQGSTSDLLNATGALNINPGASAKFSLLGNITKTQFVVAHGATLTGTFAPTAISFSTAAGVPTPTLDHIDYSGGNLTLSLAPKSLRGNFNLDSTVNGDDVAVMMSALTDLNAFAAAHALSISDMNALGDFDNSGNATTLGVTNRDLQGMLTYLAGLSSTGSVSAVPEPGTAVLLGMGGLILLAARRARRTSSTVGRSI